jgi:hypothetical protein
MDLEIQFAKTGPITIGDMIYYDTLVSVCAGNRRNIANPGAKIANTPVFESVCRKK